MAFLPFLGFYFIYYHGCVSLKLVDAANIGGCFINLLLPALQGYVRRWMGYGLPEQKKSGSLMRLPDFLKK